MKLLQAVMEVCDKEDVPFLFTDQSVEAMDQMFGEMKIVDLMEYFFAPFNQVIYAFPARRMVLSATFGQDEAGRDGCHICVFMDTGGTDVAAYLAAFYDPSTEGFDVTTLSDDEISKANAGEPNSSRVIVRLQEELANVVLSQFVQGTCYLNNPDLHVRSPFDVSRLNRNRVGPGRQALRSYTVVGPSEDMREFSAEERLSRKGLMPLHKVRAHRRRYTMGNPIEGYRKVIKLVKPFMRGDPKNGTRDPRYKV